MFEVSRRAAPEFAFAEHEHRELTRGIDRLHELGGLVGIVTSRDLAAALAGVLHWFVGTFQPHVAWENAALYPVVDRVAGSPWATKLMRFEHHQIEAAANRLESNMELLPAGLTHEQAVEFRAQVFALEALLRAHIAREELFLLPLLDEDLPALEAEMQLA